MRTYVLYHANCWDGIVSAWVHWSATGRGNDNRISYHPMNYGDPLPFGASGEKCNVVMLDFSMPRDILQGMINLNVAELLIIDHHKTAQEALAGFGDGLSEVEVIFDIQHSGAALTYRYFWPEIDWAEQPELVQYVEDRDLWCFFLPDSKLVNAYIQSWPMKFESYETLNRMFKERSISQFALLGQAVEQYKDTMVERLCINNMQMLIVGGHRVPVVNTPLLMSEVGNALCKMYEAPFSAYFFDRGDGKVQWGLRSIGDFDVSAVAKAYKGGGHKNAAGFEMNEADHYSEFIHGL